MILAREGSNLAVPSTIIGWYSMNKYYRFAAASFNISQFYPTKIGNSKIYRLHTPNQIFGQEVDIMVALVNFSNV